MRKKLSYFSEYSLDCVPQNKNKKCLKKIYFNYFISVCLSRKRLVKKVRKSVEPLPDIIGLKQKCLKKYFCISLLNY